MSREGFYLAASGRRRGRITRVLRAHADSRETPFTSGEPSATPTQGWNHEPVRAAGLGDASASQFRSPIGLVDVQQNREKVIQQEARVRTLMCGRRPGMQEQ